MNLICYAIIHNNTLNENVLSAVHYSFGKSQKVLSNSVLEYSPETI